MLCLGFAEDTFNNQVQVLLTYFSKSIHIRIEAFFSWKLQITKSVMSQLFELLLEVVWCDNITNQSDLLHCILIRFGFLNCFFGLLGKLDFKFISLSSLERIKLRLLSDLRLRILTLFEAIVSAVVATTATTSTTSIIRLSTSSLPVRTSTASVSSSTIALLFKFFSLAFSGEDVFTEVSGLSLRNVKVLELFKQVQGYSALTLDLTDQVFHLLLVFSCQL